MSIKKLPKKGITTPPKTEEVIADRVLEAGAIYIDKLRAEAQSNIAKAGIKIQHPKK